MSDERRAAMARTFGEQYGGAPELWVRAPGRVDLMGSHTDYSQGYVLTLSIGLETWLAARRRGDQTVACYSRDTGSGASFGRRAPASAAAWWRLSLQPRSPSSWPTSGPPTPR